MHTHTHNTHTPQNTPHTWTQTHTLAEADTHTLTNLQNGPCSGAIITTTSLVLLQGI